MTKTAFIEDLIEEIKEERNNLFDQIENLHSYDESLKLISRIDELNDITNRIVKIVRQHTYYDQISEVWGYEKSDKAERSE